MTARASRLPREVGEGGLYEREELEDLARELLVPWGTKLVDLRRVRVGNSLVAIVLTRFQAGYVIQYAIECVKVNHAGHAWLDFPVPRPATEPGGGCVFVAEDQARRAFAAYCRTVPRAEPLPTNPPEGDFSMIPIPQLPAPLAPANDAETSVSCPECGGPRLANGRSGAWCKDCGGPWRD